MSRASTLAKAIGADGAIAVSGNTTLGDASTDTVTFNAATASIPNGINFTNGNFGIGVASPNTYSGYSTFQLGQQTSGSIVNFQGGATSSTSAAHIRLDVSGTTVSALTIETRNQAETSATPIIFKTQETERTRIDSAGNLILNGTQFTGMRAPSFQIGTSGVLRSEHYATNNTQVKIVANAFEYTDTSYKRIYAEPTSMYSQNAGIHYWSSGATGAAGGDAALSGTMTLDGSGNLSLVGNLSVASGKGIDFSASSNVGGMTSELLDDYETGTFNPVIYDSGSGSATMTANTFKYTKIGNLVFVTGTLVWSSTSGLSAGSRLQLRGLPFTSANSPSDYRSAFSVGSSNTAFNVTRAQIAMGVDPGVSFVWFTLVNGNNQDYGMNKDSITTAGTIYGITGTYQTN